MKYQPPKYVLATMYSDMENAEEVQKLGILEPTEELK